MNKADKEIMESKEFNEFSKVVLHEMLGEYGFIEPGADRILEAAKCMISNINQEKEFLKKVINQLIEVTGAHSYHITDSKNKKWIASRKTSLYDGDQYPQLIKYLNGYL